MKKLYSTVWIVYLTLAFILLTGIFLRFYNLDSVYTEYDDVGVVSLHKSLASQERDVTLYQDKILSIDVKISTDTIRDDLLDGLWYPIYLGYVWTYPVGQYLLYPLFIDEADTYTKKIVLSRVPSALFSSLSLFLLLYLLYLLNNKRIDVQLLLPVSLLAFSYNNVLYAHHASPYSLTVTTLLISLIVFVMTMQKTIGSTCFFVIHAALTFFNYLTLIFLPIYVILFIFYHKLYNFQLLLSFFYRGVFFFILLFTPVYILFFKPSKGLHGSVPPELFSFEYLLYFPNQFLEAISSATMGLFINETLTFWLILGITFLAGYTFIKEGVKNRNMQHLIILFIILFACEWILLHASGKIIMDKTRHLLMWTPLVSIMTFYAMKRFVMKSPLILIPLVLLIVIGIGNTSSVIDSKKNVLDLNMIESSEADTILTYGFTLSPLIAFPNKRVFNIDVQSFNEESFGPELPQMLTLVSQSIDIYTYLNSKDEESFVKILIDKYKIEVLKEVHTGVYFPYNNYPVSSTENGCFIYQLEMKE